MNRDLDGLFKTAVGSMIIILPADFSALSPDQRKVNLQFRSIQDSILFLLNTTRISVRFSPPDIPIYENVIYNIDCFQQLLDLETTLSMVQTELSVYAIKWSEAAAALLSDVLFQNHLYYCTS